MRPYIATFWRENPQLPNKGYSITQLLAANSISSARKEARRIAGRSAYGTLSLLVVKHATCSHNFSQSQLETLWEMFGDIPINDNDQIEKEFLGFKKGTNRFEIWKWFDERYKGGVASLSGQG